MAKQKRNVVQVISIIAAVVVIIALLYFLARLAIIDYNSETPNNPITNITSIITCLVASTSLLVTVYHSTLNRKARKNERKQDIEYYWYKALIVDKFLPKIFDFFTSCKDTLVESLQTVNERNEKNNLTNAEYKKFLKKEFLEPFTSQYTQVQEEIIITSAIVSDSLSLGLKEEFEAFQDKFLDLSQMQSPDYLKMKQCVIESQKNIITLIKTFNENIIE